MSWREILANGGATQRAYHEYIDERIASLTKTCVSTASSFEDIRTAQAGIGELQRMKNLPDTLKRETLAKGN